ncbi:hypothetical protein Enr10x_13410 [Gimesia panareensis]|uniref:Uncharacterized protein n=1 Tax=Gimesia panareensis TaxID=2527978 RepID=A0A517Q352_9PLAN|nr:hypothetical protein [Gimesia panareensis]QDT26043.1 hypothetical protein Enr10x_13410 [Gimesia panareensis]
MYRFFILILTGCLALPAVPVSGCECGQKQTSKSDSCCCCSKSATDSQAPQPKSCCCKTSKPVQQQEKTSSEQTSQQKQFQCEKTGCHCQHTFSQPATTISVKSVELAQQLRCNWDLIDLTAPLSPATRPAASDSREPNSTELPCSAEEHCAHFCLWLI